MATESRPPPNPSWTTGRRLLNIGEAGNGGQAVHANSVVYQRLAAFSRRIDAVRFGSPVGGETNVAMICEIERNARLAALDGLRLEPLMSERWLPFLNAYRTKCLFPDPNFRQVLENVRGYLSAA